MPRQSFVCGFFFLLSILHLSCFQRRPVSPPFFSHIIWQLTGLNVSYGTPFPQSPWTLPAWHLVPSTRLAPPLPSLSVGRYAQASFMASCRDMLVACTGSLWHGAERSWCPSSWDSLSVFAFGSPPPRALPRVDNADGVRARAMVPHANIVPSPSRKGSVDPLV